MTWRKFAKFVCLLTVGSLLVANQSQLAAQTATAFAVPDNDSFVRSATPTSNYGAGGALSVSGAASTNDLGQQNGLFNSLILFPLTNVITSFDETFGAHNWLITRVRLILNESAAPMNSIFNRGVGAFEVFWIASNNWIEGTGKPNMPTTDGVAWQDLTTILNSNLDTSLGMFTNAGVDGAEFFSLALADRFISGIRQAGEVALRLTAASPNVGFTFNSRNFGNTNAQPLLEVTATTDPKAQIESITITGTNILIQFSTISNWTYHVQGASGLGSAWSNLHTFSPQSTNGHASFVDGVTNVHKFYRLLVSQ